VSTSQPLRSEDWLGKASAGLVCGYALAIGLTGLFAWLGPGGLMHSSAKTQLNMWLVAPIWVTVLSTCFLFRSGRRAWAWLLLANALCYLVLFGVRALME
jgi:cytochrome bd-type quinol oxidase subunit 2